jgi:ethanolamine utilization protein EutQ (cupin superfamily)
VSLCVFRAPANGSIYKISLTWSVDYDDIEDDKIIEGKMKVLKNRISF